MSVRNYSVKNYTKIAPFPPSSKTFTDDRIASKRIYDLRTTTYKGKPRGVREHYDTSDIENEYPNKASEFPNDGGTTYRVNKSRDTPKQIGKLSNNVSKYADDYLKNNPVKTDKMMTRETKVKNRKVGADNRVKDTYQSERNRRGTYTTSARSDEQEYGVSMTTNQKPLRPKSARPESRWGRRSEPDDTEVLYDSTKPSRPKSARPTSRMMRMIETQLDDDDDFLNDLPERPKTSHARRRSVADDELFNDSNTGIADRPKSRLGRDPDVLKVFYSDTDSLTDSSDSYSLDDVSEIEKELSKNRKPKQKVKSSQRDKSGSGVDVSPGGFGNGLSNESPGMFARGSTMYDLNSRIDDIDLDVDPVEYFMQDDHISNRTGNRKPSLSKDTISYIGNTRKPHQDKVVKGYHGYNQNKQYLKADVTDRYHGNGFQNPQYSISESNQRCVNQEILGKINRKTDKLQNYSLANGDVYQSRGTARNALRYSKPEVSRGILAKYTTLGTANGYLTQTGKAPVQGEDFRRKPRKLDPIFPSNMKPF